MTSPLEVPDSDRQTAGEDDDPRQHTGRPADAPAETGTPPADDDVDA